MGLGAGTISPSNNRNPECHSWNLSIQHELPYQSVIEVNYNSWLGGSTSIQSVWDLRGERALSAHDVAHRLVLTGAWEMPFGTGRRFGSTWMRPVDLIRGG